MVCETESTTHNQIVCHVYDVKLCEYGSGWTVGGILILRFAGGNVLSIVYIYAMEQDFGAPPTT